METNHLSVLINVGRAKSTTGGGQGQPRRHRDRAGAQKPRFTNGNTKLSLNTPRVKSPLKRVCRAGPLAGRALAEWESKFHPGLLSRRGQG